jgi:hypothetical protein
MNWLGDATDIGNRASSAALGTGPPLVPLGVTLLLLDEPPPHDATVSAAARAAQTGGLNLIMLLFL